MKARLVCLVVAIAMVISAFSQISPGPATSAPATGGGETSNYDMEGLRRLFRDGLLEAMGPACTALLGTRPEDPELRALYSIYFMARGEPVAAQSQYQRLEPSRPDQNRSIPVLCAVAMMSRVDGKRDAALQACRQAIAVDATHPYAWNILGRLFYEAGELPQAVEAFRRAVQVHERFAPAYWNLGAIAYQTADYQASLKAYQRAIELNPADCGSRYGIALALEAEGQMEAALAQLNEMLTRCADNTDLMVNATQLQVRMGQAEKALPNALRLHKLGMPGADVILADAYLQLGNLALAWGILTNTAAPTPSLEYLRGYAELMSQRSSEALDAMRRVLQKEPSHIGAQLAATALQLSLGKSAAPLMGGSNTWPQGVSPLASFISASIPAAQDQWGEVLGFLQGAEGIVPGFSVVGVDAATLAATTRAAELPMLNLGVLLYLKHLHSSALEAFQRTLQVHPDSPLGNYWAGIASGSLGRKAQARDYFERATRRLPRFFAALFAAGELHFALGTPDKAAECFRNARAIKPDPGLSLRLGSYWEHVGQLAEAETEYRNLLQEAPGFFVAHNQLAWLLAKQGIQLEEALQLALKADELMPGNASVLDTLGWIQHLKNDNAQALKTLLRSVGVNPKDPGVWYHLAVVQNSLGDPTTARKSLDSALALQTPFEDAAKARTLRQSLR
jgi:tetratricopeptide (TPR) repeat protein